MSQAIRPGTVMMRDSTIAPERFGLESIEWMPGWKIIKDLRSYSIGQKVRTAGWSFVFVGYPLKGTAIGGSRKTECRALRGILSKLGTSRFNALEVTAVTSSRFLGIPFVTVLASSRHIHELVRIGVSHEKSLDYPRGS